MTHLLLVEEWMSGGRAFVALRSMGEAQR